jgi:hypothetical protein
MDSGEGFFFFRKLNLVENLKFCLRQLKRRL